MSRWSLNGSIWLLLGLCRSLYPPLPLCTPTEQLWHMTAGQSQTARCLCSTEIWFNCPVNCLISYDRPALLITAWSDCIVVMICSYLCGFWGEFTVKCQITASDQCICVWGLNSFEFRCHMIWVMFLGDMKINSLVLFSRILQTPAAYVPLDPEAPGLLSARVMTQCGLKYCAVKTDTLQVE